MTPHFLGKDSLRKQVRRQVCTTRCSKTSWKGSHTKYWYWTSWKRFLGKPVYKTSRPARPYLIARPTYVISNTKILIVLDIRLFGTDFLGKDSLRKQVRRQDYTTRCSKNFLKRSHTNILIVLDIRLFGTDFLGKYSLRKQVRRQVYTTRPTNKGGVIGEPWFPIN